MYKIYAHLNVTNCIFVLYSRPLPSKFSRKILTWLCFTVFKINLKNVLQLKCEALISNKPLVLGAESFLGFRWSEQIAFWLQLFSWHGTLKRVIQAGNRSSIPKLFVRCRLIERACRFKNGSTVLLIPFSNIVNPVEI